MLCRELTTLPPNELGPGAYRKRVAALAREHGWKREEFDFARLKKAMAAPVMVDLRNIYRRDEIERQIREGEELAERMEAKAR